MTRRRLGRLIRRARIAQRLASLALRIDLRRALLTQRKMMGGTQVSRHSEFAVHIRGDGFRRQVLGRAEASRSTHRGVALRRELRGQS